VNAHVGGYEVDAELGRGATGVVYRAHDDRGVVALKVLDPALALDPSFRTRFAAEADVLALVWPLMRSAGRHSDRPNYRSGGTRVNCVSVMRGDVDPGEVPPRSETLARMDRALLYCFLAVRAVHVAQGVICVVSGRHGYRHRKRAALVLAGAALESAWIAQRGLRRGALDGRIATVDAGVGVVGLSALANCLAPADRTASMNWMLPYSVGSSMAMGVALPPQMGVTAAGGLAATYLVSVRDSLGGGEASSVVAVANAASYLGFYGVSRLMVSFLERNSTQLEAARRQAIERGERLATNRHRTYQQLTLPTNA
jgi:hypothetical protein